MMEKIIAHTPPPRKPLPDTSAHRPFPSVTGDARATAASAPDRELIKQQMQQLAWLMDESIPIPFLGMRVGVDGLLGLIPGVGDLLSAGISSFIIRQAHMLGVPRTVLLRMGFNTAVDLVIGAVPLLGDLLDFSWKANKRNVRLVLNHLEHPTRTQRSSGLAVAGMLVAITAVAGALVYSCIALLSWLFS